MKLNKTSIEGAHLIELHLNKDDRGLFTEILKREEFERLSGLKFNPLQMNLSTSQEAGTVRGLHYQRDPHGQSKIVWCVSGVLQDVIVDAREHSPTYGKYYSIVLQPHKEALYIPKGVAHGWQSLTDNATLLYWVDAPWVQLAETGVAFDDEDLNIPWGMKPKNVSTKDKLLNCLRDEL